MIKRNTVAMIVILLVNCLCISSAMGIPVIVGYKDAASALNATMSAAHNAELLDPDIFAVAMDIPEDEINSLNSDTNVRFIENDEIFTTASDPRARGSSIFTTADSLKVPWNIRQIHADEVHLRNIDGKGVRVAIMDTGIDYTHPDLKGVFAGGYNYVASTADPLDDNNHGTHCAGILAATGMKQLVGTAPNVSVYAIKVLDSKRNGNLSSIIKGIYWAKKNLIKVVSMSLGSAKDSVVLHEAVDDATKNGILFVAASGNRYNARLVDYPANYSSVLSVAAVDRNNQHLSFSNGGKVDISAPGKDILSTIPGGAYLETYGTSQATPHVAGVAAMIFELHPDWTPEQVKNQIKNTATYLGPSDVYGAGLVNAANATLAG
jgi:subtilisin